MKFLFLFIFILSSFVSLYGKKFVNKESYYNLLKNSKYKDFSSNELAIAYEIQSSISKKNKSLLKGSREVRDLLILNMIFEKNILSDDNTFKVKTGVKIIDIKGDKVKVVGRNRSKTTTLISYNNSIAIVGNCEMFNLKTLSDFECDIYYKDKYIYAIDVIGESSSRNYFVHNKKSLKFEIEEDSYLVNNISYSFYPNKKMKSLTLKTSRGYTASLRKKAESGKISQEWIKKNLKNKKDKKPWYPVEGEKIYLGDIYLGKFSAQIPVFQFESDFINYINNNSGNISSIQELDVNKIVFSTRHGGKNYVSLKNGKVYKFDDNLLFTPNLYNYFINSESFSIKKYLENNLTISISLDNKLLTSMCENSGLGYSNSKKRMKKYFLEELPTLIKNYEEIQYNSDRGREELYLNFSISNIKQNITLPSVYNNQNLKPELYYLITLLNYNYGNRINKNRKNNYIIVPSLEKITPVVANVEKISNKSEVPDISDPFSGNVKNKPNENIVELPKKNIVSFEPKKHEKEMVKEVPTFNIDWGYVLPGYTQMREDATPYRGIVYASTIAISYSMALYHYSFIDYSNKISEYEASIGAKRKKKYKEYRDSIDEHESIGKTFLFLGIGLHIVNIIDLQYDFTGSLFKIKDTKITPIIGNDSNNNLKLGIKLNW
ncbi:MAG: hypothetical protein CR982_10150 [Candidatus Cloacimonadota bacterium]|nr:MAG: hypothetical protein CR982_10150 [Candidatus Cloacimonadota bacterium]PIE78519.1 MAG: hypothetical protein CSA15_07440 [Candidatus Delongbacteria bacterium]